MPTSASTGTKQTKTAGDSKPETVANTEVRDKAGKDRNTPDGAPVVTREEDVVGGVRVDLPPSAPAVVDPGLPGPSSGGVLEVNRPDGSRALVNTGEDGWEKRADDIRAGKRHA